MTCKRVALRDGMVCHIAIGNDSVSIGKYNFEWSNGCGWLPCNKDGSERLSPVPKHIWGQLERLDKAGMLLEFKK